MINLLKKNNKLKVYDSVLEKNKIFPQDYKKLRLLNFNNLSKFNMIILMNNNIDNYEFLKKKIVKRKKNKKFYIFFFLKIENKKFVKHHGFFYNTLGKTYH